MRFVRKIVQSDKRMPRKSRLCMKNRTNDRTSSEYSIKSRVHLFRSESPGGGEIVTQNINFAFTFASLHVPPASHLLKRAL